MKFVNRHEELARLNRLMESNQAALAVVWGRRRVGKTRLLLEWSHQWKGIYYPADESSPSVQRRYFSLAIEQKIPGFSSVEYADWSSLLTRLAKEAIYEGWRGPLIIDELPYLISNSPELPSVLQSFIDHEAKKAKMVVAFCGSSQQMMQGAVLDASSPLFGRAHEVMKLGPIGAGYMGEALDIKNAIEIVENYSIWGGIPRYWELVKNGGLSLFENIDRLVLNPLGALNDEPNRLLLEESAIHLRPILDAIGLGAHRLSEVAMRIGMPITSFSRSVQRLLELDLIEKEVPFGADEKNSKKTLYKIKDPFIRFWFRVVASQRSFLAQARAEQRLHYLEEFIHPLFSIAWEELCRSAAPHLSVWDNKLFKPASRYWHKSEPEFDILTETLDGKILFIGEAKWTKKAVSKEWVHQKIDELKSKGLPLGLKRHYVFYGLFIPEKPKGLNLPPNVVVVNAKEVLNAL
ncbi:MAG: ATP-binding protein [Parachlamydia sp.]|jgi:hypothetical protein|nr:ATP-binding protein [Parachlamydia sp.]